MCFAAVGEANLGPLNHRCAHQQSDLLPSKKDNRPSKTMGAGATISDRFRDDVRMDHRLKPLNSTLEVAIKAGAGAMSHIKTRDEMLAFYVGRPKRPPPDVESLEMAPADGLTITQMSIPTSEEGKTINLCIMRPDMDDLPPCVYYIHGGGMMTSSCFDPMYQTWGRTMARQGVCVVMPDFRNSMNSSSVEEVAPFPAGHNDCVDGLKWVHTNADMLKIDGSRILLSGESGGGNLALTTGIRLKREVHSPHREFLIKTYSLSFEQLLYRSPSYPLSIDH